jgi:flagellar hook-associated protein 2
LQFVSAGHCNNTVKDGEQGKLKINESRLRAAIEEDPEGVARLFNNKSDAASEQGIATSLYDTLNGVIGRITSQAGSAATLYDQSYISRTIRDIDDQINSMEDRLAMVEERYWRQFTAMEKAISSMNQQSSWLSSQLMGMMGQ